MRVSSAERKRVEDVIRRAEGEAHADFVCVLARAASDYEYYPLVWATLASLLTPWVLILATSWSVVTILAVQLVVFAALMLLLGLPALRHRLVPRRVQRAAAHRMATEQFVIRDLATTESRRAVLLFVSERERYARVLAGAGAEAAVPDGHWRSTVDLLVAAAKQGRHADGFVAAIEHCATALKASSRAEGAGRENALPDRFIVLG